MFKITYKAWGKTGTWMCLRGESWRGYFEVRNGKLTSHSENFMVRSFIISTPQGILFVGESPKENNTGVKCLNARIVLDFFI